MTDPKSIALDQTVVGDSLPPASTALPGGQVVAGRYELLGLIGAGGMGRVYRAHDRELEEDIALKVLQRDLLGSGLVRFIQEVKLARRVTHRNVARTYDIGEHQGERFLTMELVEGEPLTDLIARRGGLGQAEAVAIGRQVCAGMAAAHAAGVIHRDLKPDNVLIARDGRAVITDFGIARTHLPGADAGAGMTSGKVLGTPAYMAPEQVESRADIDARADVYAFGELLYEALTGERTWQGDSPFVVAMARLLQPPPDPRARRADLPAPLAELVLRCLARDRDQRFASADELARALDAVAASPRGAAATLPTPTAWQVPRREKTVAVLAFRNLGLPEDAYMVEGLIEDLLDVLASVEGLRVRSRGAGPAAGDAAEEGRRLGVDVVVEGSVRRAGAMMRVSARLVSVHDGFQIWSARFDRPLSEAFGLNDEVARAIAQALSASGDVAPRRPPTDPAALDLYLRARHELSRAWSTTDNHRALDLLEQALALAPHDPTILSAYAVTHLRQSFLSPGSTPALEPIVERALAAAPHQGEPWVALAALRWNTHDDAPGAARAARRALVEAPGLAEASDQAGRLLLEAGDLTESVALLERALWLDESLPWPRLDLIRAMAYLGRWERVDALVADRDVASWPQEHLAHQRLSLWRDDGRAPPPLVLPSSADPRPALLSALVTEMRRTHQLSDDARAFIARTIAAQPARTRSHRLFAQLATELHAFVGDHAEAQRYALHGADAGLLDLAWVDRCPLLAPYRAEPWFVRLREPVARRAADVIAAWREPPEPLPRPATGSRPAP